MKIKVNKNERRKFIGKGEGLRQKGREKSWYECEKERMVRRRQFELRAKGRNIV
jgi:hypothetical protein